jgi:hypothetical protein
VKHLRASIGKLEEQALRGCLSAHDTHIMLDAPEMNVPSAAEWGKELRDVHSVVRALNLEVKSAVPGNAEIDEMELEVSRERVDVLGEVLVNVIAARVEAGLVIVRAILGPRDASQRKKNKGNQKPIDRFQNKYSGESPSRTGNAAIRRAA